MILANEEQRTGTSRSVENSEELCMNVLLYAAKQTASGERLKQSIETLTSLESLTDCGSIAELIQYLRNPDPLPETVVLQATSHQDLQVFEPFRFRLEMVFFVLVLPDADTETVARGHQLRPRFIAYQDSDFSEVGAVLARLESRQDHRFGAGSSRNP
jgi:hypothetical protein